MSNLEKYRAYLDTAIDFIFPPLCAGCGEYNNNNQFVCDHCRKRIEYCSQPFCLKCRTVLSDKLECFDCKDQSPILFAITHYNDPMPEIVKHFKFKNIVGLSKLIASNLPDRFKEMIADFKLDALVPIPLSVYRENQRGYNQAELFADDLAEILNIKVRDDILMRTKRRHPQARLKLEKRSKNIEDVFKLIEIEDKVERVALVDDVVTSGLTTLEAIKTLKKANIKVPIVISMAQAF